MEIDLLRLPEDREELCRTAADAWKGWNTVAGLPGDLFIMPFAEHPSSLCRVLRGPDGIAGCIAGTESVVNYVWWYNSRWIEELQQRYGEVLEEEGVQLDKKQVPTFVETYPASAQVYIAPEARRNGYAKRLVLEFSRLLTEKNIPGWYMEVPSHCTEAMDFCSALGFSLIAWKRGVRFFGKQLPSGIQ